MAFAVEESMQDGCPVELRVDIARFEQYRARWLGNEPSSYATVYRMLVASEMHDELTRLNRPTLVIGVSLDRTTSAKPWPTSSHTPPEVRTSHYMAVQTPDIIFDGIDAFLRAVDA